VGAALQAAAAAQPGVQAPELPDHMLKTWLLQHTLMCRIQQTVVSCGPVLPIHEVTSPQAGCLGSSPMFPCAPAAGDLPAPLRSLQGPVIETRVTFGGSSAPPKLNPLSCDGIIDTDISGGLEATKRRGCQARSCSIRMHRPWNLQAAQYRLQSKRRRHHSNEQAA
jgi:hypothetical protein